MKKMIFFLTIACSCSQVLNAQRFELYGTVYSGLAKLRGEAATNTTSMVRYGSNPSEGLTSNIYGKKTGFSTGAEAQLTIPTKFKMVFNLSAGYESLATVVSIDQILPAFWSSFFISEPAKGKTTFRTEFINIFPSAGYRTKLGKLKLDIDAGIVLASCIKSNAKGTAISLTNNEQVHSELKTDQPKKDIRPSLQIMAQYKKLGLIAGYQWGVVNYCDLLIGTDRQMNATMRFLKLGISYRIK